MIKINLLKGDCLHSLKKLPDNSVDSIVTDPPYGLSFMGKDWDYDVPKVDVWREAMRVLKPGGHLLAFFGTRTYHRGVVQIEDAGFEIRDQIMWIYGSGFPKSHNIGKAIDKAAGVERTDSYVREDFAKRSNKTEQRHSQVISGKKGIYTLPATDAAKQWEGWGTALKPANEPIVVARKPLEKGLTIAENVVKWGCGAINIDECRIEGKLEGDPNRFKKTDGGWGVAEFHEQPVVRSEGRWPANIMFDEEAAAVLDEQSGQSKSSSAKRNNKPSANTAMSGANLGHISSGHDDSGGASRFFYVAKASKSERNKGLEGMPKQRPNDGRNSGLSSGIQDKAMASQENFHPTVKPIKLMQYLIKLVTPPNGTVLDPFMGSGTTGVAAKQLGFNFIGCELSPEYMEIAKKRIDHVEIEKIVETKEPQLSFEVG